MLMPLRKRPRSETCATVELSFSGPVRRHMSCNCKSLLQCSPFLRLGDSAPMGEVRNLRHDVIEEVGWSRWRFHLSFKVRPIVVVIRTLSAFSGWCVAGCPAPPQGFPGYVPQGFPGYVPQFSLLFSRFPSFQFSSFASPDFGNPASDNPGSASGNPILLSIRHIRSVAKIMACCPHKRVRLQRSVAPPGKSSTHHVIQPKLT
jgi:hypothetical protein